jgi:hypothetical protein
MHSGQSQKDLFCWTCLAGTYSVEYGSTACSICDAGSYSKELFSGVTNFWGYSEGYFFYGGTFCYSCPAGKTFVPDLKQSDLHMQSAYPGNSIWPASNLDCYSCVDKLTYAPTEKSPTCLNCTLCTGAWKAPYNFMTHDCNITSDRQCSGVCAMKSSYNEYFVSWCNSTSNSTFATCDQCPKGKYISSGCDDDTQPVVNVTGRNTKACSDCPGGTYSETSSWLKNTCIPCQTGKYSQTVGASSILTCLNCTRGTFANKAAGNTECSICRTSCGGWLPASQLYAKYACNATHDLGCFPCNKCRTNLNPLYANKSLEYFRNWCTDRKDSDCALCTNCSTGQYVGQICQDGYNTDCR